MKRFLVGLTLGILVTGAVLKAAEFKSPEGSGGVPGPFVPGQPFSFVPTFPIDPNMPGGIYTSPPTVHCGSFSPEALEQIRKAVLRP